MKRWVATLLLVAVLWIGMLLLVSFLIKAQRPDVIGFGVFLFVILGLGLLSARSEKVDRTLKAAFRAYVAFLLKVLAAVGPVVVFHALSTHLVERLSLPFQVLILVVWGCLLAGALLLIAHPSPRQQLFELLERLGAFAPVVYSFNVLVISIVFFATASHILLEHEFVAFLPGRDIDPSISHLTDFYLWHFMDSVPLLDINETVRWKAPFEYDRPGVGWILLLFKFAVIIPVVAAFRGYWVFRKERQEEKQKGEA